ncbi:MAG: mannose-1-phosphate guanylyltransferase/mannose-6-phosphate isomerase [Campylobacterales bacterium]|nr:mannose-1-phosphate guanylyltransferase/mannose-6-phosphate isomerase [Campylobacterales bacterium]
MTNIILCGGSGTRLWPMSRTLMPKQFVKLFDSRSLFQLTVARNRVTCNRHYIVSNAEQYFIAVDQMHELDPKDDSAFLLEPIGRNTAPAIALACMDIDPEETVLVTPSDHLIKNEAAYLKAIRQAASLAGNGYLVTFGIQPTEANTGYGYIEADGDNVISFKEKPDAQTAQAYVDAGNFYWNSGMFCFKAGVFLQELQAHAPDIYSTCRHALAEREQISPRQQRIPYAAMLSIPEDSIDYAVMEKSRHIKVVAADMGWSDLGSFDALSDEIPSSTNVISIDATDNLIRSDKQVAAIGVENLIVIDTPDALLICAKGATQKVKQVVERLKHENPELTKVHTLAHRPWGTYEVLLSHDNYKIKRIVVQPGKRLSLQKHFHRNEHWIVVSGTATVTVGDETRLIRPNESTYIKMGEQHRLANEGKIPVVLIEAQVGEYTGEDDIVRIDEDFKRD